MPTTITSIELVDQTGGHNEQGVNFTEMYHVYFSGGFTVAGIMAGAVAAGLPVRNSTASFNSAAYVSEVGPIKLADSEGGVQRRRQGQAIRSH